MLPFILSSSFCSSSHKANPHRVGVGLASVAGRRQLAAGRVARDGGGAWPRRWDQGTARGAPAAWAHGSWCGSAVARGAWLLAGVAFGANFVDPGHRWLLTALLLVYDFLLRRSSFMCPIKTNRARHRWLLYSYHPRLDIWWWRMQHKWRVLPGPAHISET